jgi:DNA-binding MarR family transcriptional regulator
MWNSIVATILERSPAAAGSTLGSWMQALVDYVRSGEPDLTNRQMALLLVVYLRPGPHTVRGLARVLNVSKPVVTRALNRLGALGYLRRQRDDTDKRNIFVAKTSEGAEFLEEFGQFLGDAEQPAVRRASA